MCIKTISCRLDAKNSSKKEDSSHFYDEIDDMLSNRSKAADDKESRFSKDEVVFDAATSWVPPQDEDSLYDIVDTLAQSPQLATTTSANDDEWKIKCNYEIMGLGIGKQCTKEKS